MRGGSSPKMDDSKEKDQNKIVVEEIKLLDGEVDDEGRSLGGGAENYYDGTGFFNYNDMYDWTDAALYAHSCYESNDGPMIVYDLFKAGHNQCSKKKMGTYQTSVSAFVRAWVTQQARDAEITGAEYKAKDVIQYLYCTGEKINDVYYYYKLGCRESTGRGLQVHAYSDAYCTERANVYSNNYIDTSALQVSFEYCRNCEFSYSNYNGAAGGYGYYGNGAGAGGYYWGNQNNGEMRQHQSPLCSAMYYYGEKCGYNCQRNAKKASKSSSSSAAGGRGRSFSSYNDAYTPIEIFFLWLLSLSAIFYLMKGLSYRKKFSKRHQLVETMAMESAGLGKETLTRLVIFISIFITLLIVFRRKILTWFSLAIVNLVFISYYVHLKRKSHELMNSEGDAQEDGYELHNDRSDGGGGGQIKRVYTRE